MTDIILTPETVKILRNYSIINQSVKVTPGKVIRTLSNSNIVLSKADVEEDFKTPWAVYDMPEFLSVIETFKNPVLAFSSKSVLVREQDEKKGVTYRFADPEIVHSTDKDLTMPVTEVNFILSEEELTRLLKTAAVLRSPHFVIENADSRGAVKISVMDVDNPATNVYSTDIPADDVIEEKFRFIFKVENLLVIPGEYNIGISSKLISHWLMGQLNYWIALETSSSFGQ